MLEWATLIQELGFATVAGAVFFSIVKKVFDKMLNNFQDSLKDITRDLKEIKYQNAKFAAELREIEKKLEVNTNGLRIAINATVLQEKLSLKNELFDIINNNHFKDDVSYLISKLNNATNKFKSDLHSKLYQISSDKELVEIIDIHININEDIKSIFVEEIEKEKTNYDFLKNKIDNYLKTMRTNIIDQVYKYYEDKK